MGFEGISVKRMLQNVHHQPLTASQEIALLRESKRGDSDARDRLVEANQRFVVRMALSYRNQGLAVSDLVQEGTLGLIEAIDRYDESKNCRLISYAAWWIRLFMQRAVEQKSRTVTIPINKVATLKKIRNFEYNYIKSNGKKPSYTEISESVGLKPEKVEAIYHMGTSSISLYAEDEEGQSIEHRLQCDDRETLRNNIWEDQLNTCMDRALNQLSNREKAVLSCRFGLGGQDPLSLRQAGKKLGLSAEGVRQIQAQAINKLRDPSIGGLLGAFVN